MREKFCSAKDPHESHKWGEFECPGWQIIRAESQVDLPQKNIEEELETAQQTIQELRSKLKSVQETVEYTKGRLTTRGGNVVPVSLVKQWLSGSLKEECESPSIHGWGCQCPDDSEVQKELNKLRFIRDQIREVISNRRQEVVDHENVHGPTAWSDAVSVTCNRIDNAIRFIEDGT